MSGEPIKQQLLPRRGLISSRLRDVHIYVVLCATTTVDLKSAGIQPKASTVISLINVVLGINVEGVLKLPNY